MKELEQISFSRIEKAIGYIRENFKNQPNLDEIAEKVHLSPFHFQRLFTKWAGVSPKGFLQYISIDHAKKMLTTQASLSETAFNIGLSGTNRLYDLFIKIEGMAPGEYKNGGKNLLINYSYAKSLFGDILIASTTKGVCHISFIDDEEGGFKELQKTFPNATYRHFADILQKNALQVFTNNQSKLDEIKLHLKGTEFQIKVWEALLKVPIGGLSTYGSIAKYIQQPTASRAVGSAVGDNPVAYLIPCHRIIQSSGEFGQYHWGSNRKTAIIGWEAAYIDAHLKTQ